MTEPAWRGRLAQAEQVLRRAAKAQPHSAIAQFQLGLVLQQLGRTGEAERCYRAALRLAPDHADALNNLSVLLEQKGRRDEAETLLRRAVAAHPGAGTVWCNLARLLLEADRLDAAADAFTRALGLAQVAATAQYGLGLVRRRQERLGDAETHFRAALAQNPALADADNELGLVLRRTGRMAEAEACFRRAIRTQPNLAAAHLNLGTLLLEGDRLDDAEAALRAALAARPDWADGHYSLGLALREQSKLAAAEEAFRRAVDLEAGHAAALAALGALLSERRATGAAEPLLRRAIALEPQYLPASNDLVRLLWRERREAEAHALAVATEAQAPTSADAALNLGLLAETDCDRAGATRWYERAIALDPGMAEAQFSLGRMRLLEGRFAEGWEGYEWRLRTSRAKRAFFASLAWDGSSLAGKTIVLHSEQGLGDTLQFCRYVPLVAAQGGTVILAVQPALRRLLEQLPGVSRTIDAFGERPDTDFLTPLASLPRLFHTDFAAIPSPEGYLGAPEEALERWRPRLEGGDERLRVGLCWSGNPEQALDRNRSTRLATFAPLLDVPGVRFYSLQVGPGAADIAGQGFADRIVDLGPALSDFTETAAAMTLLDLVITTDTSVPHLAGALGRPTFVLLHPMPDWRWLLERSDNPWYASHRLFRQRRRGDWAEVVAEAAAALAERAALKSPQ
ncbi:MAG TPA: tetratricopeptide repeat protein [Stellaceae bacterium]|nr:tetratricopeptide repeat protein [Stellaceae bacterium]